MRLLITRLGWKRALTPPDAVNLPDNQHVREDVIGQHQALGDEAIEHQAARTEEVIDHQDWGEDALDHLSGGEGAIDHQAVRRETFDLETRSDSQTVGDPSTSQHNQAMIADDLDTDWCFDDMD